MPNSWLYLTCSVPQNFSMPFQVEYCPGSIQLHEEHKQESPIAGLLRGKKHIKLTEQYINIHFLSCSELSKVCVHGEIHHATRTVYFDAFPHIN